MKMLQEKLMIEYTKPECSTKIMFSYVLLKKLVSTYTIFYINCIIFNRINFIHIQLDTPKKM